MDAQESVCPDRMFGCIDFVLIKVLSVPGMGRCENALSYTIPVHRFNFTLCQPAAERNFELLPDVAIVYGSFRSKPVNCRPIHEPLVSEAHEGRAGYSKEV